MNLKLIRTDFAEDGIFGKLVDEHNNEIAVTLEHAYDSGNGNGSYAPKLPNGKYKCVKGEHQLHNLIPFMTFEIEGVKGHDNILFHPGNYNQDSQGCVLVGRRVVEYTTDKARMITSSKNTFLKLMDLQKNVAEFELEVI